MKNLIENSEIILDEMKKDLSSKFGSLNLEHLNTLSHSHLMRTALYSYIYELELINRKYDGALARTPKIDDETLKSFLIKTLQYRNELESFFKSIKNG